MTEYMVRAKRWEHGWELHIDDVGVTQAHTLSEAEEMARSYIAIMTDANPATIAVTIVPHISKDIDKAVQDARQAVTYAKRVQREAAGQMRRATRRLHSCGLSGREIARLLEVSPQRVSQLLAGSKDNSEAQTEVAL